MTALQYPNGAILMDVDAEVQQVLAQAGCLAELQETPGRNWIAHGWQTPDAYDTIPDARCVEALELLIAKCYELAQPKRN